METTDSIQGNSVPPIEFNNAPQGYPMQPNRIKFETELVKKASSPKLVQELPVSEFSQKAIVDYAKYNKLAAVRHGESYFLFDRRQISENEVRQNIAAGTIGKMLGYSDDTIPDEGQQVALSVDGEYATDPQQILDWRDNDRLGLTWKTSDPDMAEAVASMHMG
jgi:hypothetical protein